MSVDPTERNRIAERGSASRWGGRDRTAAVAPGTIGLILGVVAILLGGSALGIALTGSGHVGPAGPSGSNGATGPQGPAGAGGANGKNGLDGTNGLDGANGTRGPAGPGATVEHAFTGATTSLSPNCTYYPGANLTFTASGPGEIVMTGSFTVLIFHTTGYGVSYLASFWNTTSVCQPQRNSFVQGGLASVEPSGAYYDDVSLVQAFAVPAAGNYTIATIGTASYTAGSSDVAEFYWGSVVGTFYPA